MSVPTVLFVSHSQQQCGVYQFGQNVGAVLRRSERFRFLYLECGSHAELLAAIEKERPSAIIYNYHPSTLPWLNSELTGLVSRLPQIGILHEVTQSVADWAGNEIFDYHIAPDPTLEMRNPRVFKTGRLLPHYVNEHPLPETLTVGCFGFGTVGKGFERVVTEVQRQFDHAIIRMHLPFAVFHDPDGGSARALAQRCREMITKPGIELRASHDFLSQEQLLDFLGANTINCFFYEQLGGRGISSVIDYALAAQRPLAISRSSMFRHLDGARPSVCIEDNDLSEILSHGLEPLAPYRKAWTEANLVRDYEDIIADILGRSLPPARWRGTPLGTFGWKARYGLGRAVRKAGRTLAALRR